MSFDPKEWTREEPALRWGDKPGAQRERREHPGREDQTAEDTSPHRTRRRQAGELDRILQSSERSRSKNLKPAILLAIENSHLDLPVAGRKPPAGAERGNAAPAARRASAKLTARQQAQALRWINWARAGPSVGTYHGSAARRGIPLTQDNSPWPASAASGLTNATGTVSTQQVTVTTSGVVQTLHSDRLGGRACHPRSPKEKQR
ncbi:hypothetical protein ACU4GD_31175 [Cupriavidus basilensis]